MANLKKKIQYVPQVRAGGGAHPFCRRRYILKSLGGYRSPLFLEKSVYRLKRRLDIHLISFLNGLNFIFVHSIGRQLGSLRV